MLLLLAVSFIPGLTIYCQNKSGGGRAAIGRSGPRADQVLWRYFRSLKCRFLGPRFRRNPWLADACSIIRDGRFCLKLARHPPPDRRR